jgi:hypothetical protein
MVIRIALVYIFAVNGHNRLATMLHVSRVLDSGYFKREGGTQRGIVFDGFAANEVHTAAFAIGGSLLG